MEIGKSVHNSVWNSIRLIRRTTRNSIPINLRLYWSLVDISILTSQNAIRLIKQMVEEYYENR